DAELDWARRLLAARGYVRPSAAARSAAGALGPGAFPAHRKPATGAHPSRTRARPVRDHPPVFGWQRTRWPLAYHVPAQREETPCAAGAVFVALLQAAPRRVLRALAGGTRRRRLGKLARIFPARRHRSEPGVHRDRGGDSADARRVPRPNYGTPWPRRSQRTSRDGPALRSPDRQRRDRKQLAQRHPDEREQPGEPA